MYARGEWITGIQTSNLSELTEKLKNQLLVDARKNFDFYFASYSPWMSTEECSAFFKDNRGFLIQVNRAETFNIITEMELLQFLKKAFYDNPARPFGKVLPKEAPFELAVTNEFDYHRFKDETSFALDLISKTYFKEKIATVTNEILPLHSPIKMPRPMGFGRSAHWYLGGVFIGLPKYFSHSGIEHAINLVHEAGHQSLMIYQNADTLIDQEDFNKNVYSPIRKVERPAVLSLHAVTALAFMTEFLYCLHSNPPDDLSADSKEYVLSRLKELTHDFHLGIIALSELKFTKLGSLIMKEFRQLNDFLQEKV